MQKHRHFDVWWSDERNSLVVAPLAAVAAVAVVAKITQAMTTRQTFKPASLLLLRSFLPTMRLALMQLQLCIRMPYARVGPLL